MRPPRGEVGFTLVEALLAVAIVSVALIQTWEALRLQGRYRDRVDREATGLADLSALSETLGEDSQGAITAAVETGGGLTLIDRAGVRAQYRVGPAGLTISRAGRSRPLPSLAGARFEIERVGKSRVLIARIDQSVGGRAGARRATIVRLLPGVAGP